MKSMNMKHSLLIVAAAVVAVSTASAGGPDKTPNWGTDILHYSVQDHFTNNGVESNASAIVELDFKSQGNAENQKFDFNAKRLTPSATYWLWSLKRDETNYSAVTDFTTDSKGNARLRYQSNSKSNNTNAVSKKNDDNQGNDNGQGNDNNGNGNGHGKQPLPDALDPVIDLQSLTVLDVNTQIVLQADLTAPDRFQYQVKRKLEGTNNETGLLRIEGTLKKIHFDLQALHLVPANDYLLAIDTNIVATAHSDARGQLRFNATTKTTNTTIAIHQVQLLDTSTNVVLGTQLP